MVRGLYISKYVLRGDISRGDQIRRDSAMLNKVVVFLKRVEPFRLQLGCSKKEQRPRFVGRFAKVWWKLWRLGNEL